MKYYIIYISSEQCQIWIVNPNNWQKWRHCRLLCVGREVDSKTRKENILFACLVGFFFTYNMYIYMYTIIHTKYNLGTKQYHGLRHYREIIVSTCTYRILLSPHPHISFIRVPLSYHFQKKKTMPSTHACLLNPLIFVQLILYCSALLILNWTTCLRKNWTTCLRQIDVDLWTNINLLLGRITKYAQKKGNEWEESIGIGIQILYSGIGRTGIGRR